MRQSAILMILWVVLPLPGWAEVRFDAKAVEQWADNFFQPRVAAGIFNGASFGLIQNGTTVLLKGYGYQDLAQRIPLDPYSTMIRMCSISKTFTATAILQLRDSGFIESLDDPVNKYLHRYQLPPPYGAEVTLRHLMTHTSGMAGHFTPQGTQLDIPVPVSKEQVADLFRENIERPPGTIGQYANLGVALESVVIEDISGQSLKAYFRDNILAPLGMHKSMLHHATDVPSNLAQPYGRFPNGDLQAVPFYPKHPLTAASGGIIATPAEMLRYAALHTDVDATRHPDVLSAVSRQEMQTPQYRDHPAGLSIGLHLYPERYGSENYVSHGCGLPGTQSRLGVLPDSNAGFVISILRASPTPGVRDLISRPFGLGRLVNTSEENRTTDIEPKAADRSFLETFVGPRQLPPVTSQITAGAVDAPDKISGTYWGERRSMRAFTTVFASGSVLKITADKDGTIQAGTRQLTRVSPGVYDSQEGHRYIFRQPPGSEDIYLHTNPSSAWRQVSGLGNPVLVGALALFGFGIFLTALISPWWSRANATAMWLRRNGLCMSLLIILLPIATFAGYEGVSDIALLDGFNGVTGRLIFVVLLVNLLSITGLGFVVGIVPAWRSEAPGDWRTTLWRLHITLLGLAAILTWPALLLFNLIGLNL
ncbi:MAG: serine hydrolase domain-containing protein [Pseudomonadota bacterium]